MNHRTTLLSLLILGFATQSCVEGKEETPKSVPVPEAFVESLRLARKACFQSADASEWLPRIDALIVSRELEIEAAIKSANTVTGATFSWALTDSTIESDGSLLTIRVDDVEYRYFEGDPDWYVEVVGIFKYQERIPPGWRVDCFTPEVRYKHHTSESDYHVSGHSWEWLEASYQGHVLSIDVTQDASGFHGDYCEDGTCRSYNELLAGLREMSSVSSERLVSDSILKIKHRQ